MGNNEFIEHLRDCARVQFACAPQHIGNSSMWQVADLIERQAALIEQLTKALKAISDTPADDGACWVRMVAVADAALAAARAAEK